MDRFIDGVGGFFGNSVPFGTGNVGKVAAEAEQGASKLGKLAGVSTKVAGGFAKIAGGALKCVPVIGNVLEVMGLLEAFGFHPFEAVVEGFESLTGHATNVKKAMKEVAETNEKLAKKVQNNDFFNGNDLEKKKTGENYQSILDQARKNADDQNREHAELGDGIVIKPHLEPEEFDTFQRDFNKFAKDNDVDIRIRVNDYDSIMQKVKDLNKELAKTRQGDVADGLKNINKQLDNDKDTTSSKKLDEYLNDNKDYTKARDEIMAKQGAELSGLANAKDMSMKERSRKSEEIVKEYEKQMDELNQKWKSGENARAFWTSEAGEEIEKTHRKNAKSISEEIASMRKNLGDGAMSKEDFASSSKEDLNSMEVAQAGNLNQGFGKQTAQLDKINEKLANGKKLSAEELEVLAMQNSELVKKDQSTWGEDEVKQAQAASDAQRKYVDENKANQEQVMTDIMSANGKSREEIQKTIEAYEKGGSSYIKMMAKNGQLGMDIMKVSAEFASIYGDQWADKMGEIQDKVEAIPDEKITKYTFLDEDTGLVNTELISRLNNIPEEKMTKYGFQYDKDGNLNIDSLIDSLGKVPPELLTKYTISASTK